MAKSPYIEFNETNLNEQVSTPLLGVSYVVARTTEGPVNDPGTIINNLGQFRNMYGEEIVPDGSISNIEVALKLGSKLRICRVGTTTAEPESSPDASPIAASAELVSADNIYEPSSSTPLYITFVDGEESIDIKSEMKLKSGSNITGKYLIEITKENTNINFLIYKTVDASKLKDNLVYSRRFIKLSADNSKMDVTSFSDFIQNNNYVDINLLGVYKRSTSQPFAEGIKIDSVNSWADCFTYISGLSGTDSIEVSSEDTPVTMVTPIAYSGIMPMAAGDVGEPTVSDWQSAIEHLADYTDGYQMILSHIHQNVTTSTELNACYKAAKEIAEKGDVVLYVEVPKTNTTASQIVSAVTALKGVIGESKNIAYFAGGVKYYDVSGEIVDCDTLGSVIGLGDASATNHGPWKSFAGLNRGVLLNAQGPVAVNLGAPSRYDDLDKVAGVNCNMIVIKPTSTTGQRTVLWHNFTSSLESNSFQFLNVVRCNLYIKKNLRPILERYIEEPNTFSTWYSMYLEVLPILQDLENNNAITDAEWYGDQNAASYDDLQINTEAEVRQGIYKARLVYKDVVSIQQIIIDLVIDSTTGNVEVM